MTDNNHPPIYIDTSNRPLEDKLRTAIAHFVYRFGILPEMIYLNTVDAARFESGELDGIPVFGTKLIIEGSYNLFAQPVKKEGAE